MTERTIVITGAAGALGRAAAEVFSAAGWRLALLDMSEASLGAAYPSRDPNRVVLPVVLLNDTATARAVTEVLARFGRIDALGNIAGGFDMGPRVHETTLDQWEKMQNLNVHTLLGAVRAVVPGMLAAGGGKIVNVAALAGLGGKQGMCAYSAAKSAVIRITETMSAELRERKINVNCVLPSILDTPANRAAMPDADFSRWVAPVDLAHVILFLCSETACAVHGAAIPVTGLS